MEIYVVRKGDTLYRIARYYGVSVEFLAGENGLQPDVPLIAGEALVVRIPRQTHTVQEGETLFSIAQRYGLTLRQLYRRNNALQGRNTLQRGQTLVISYEDEENRRTIRAAGYVYPYIQPELLDSTLPYLTELIPFTYGIGPEGELIPLNDSELLAAAGYYGTAGVMHLSSLTEEGSFSNDRSSLILAEPELQDRLLDAVVQTMRRKNYAAFSIDFEYVYPQEREAYAAFVSKVRNRLNPFGYRVGVALAPKTSGTQAGLLYEAHDYGLLGRAADETFLMTYEWGYTYGPPMAVAPLPQVRRVLDYAVTEIPREKILLGVPIYGYDWLLPYERGVTKAESLSPVQAVALARQTGTEIRYDETAQSPYFSYISRSGREHIVWFEDARSASAKLDLLEQYDLAGVGFWNLMRAFPQLWPLLDARFDVADESVPRSANSDANVTKNR